MERGDVGGEGTRLECQGSPGSAAAEMNVINTAAIDLRVHTNACVHSVHVPLSFLGMSKGVSPMCM